MFNSKVILNKNVARILSHPLRWKTGKAPPAKIDYELRKLMMDEDDPRFRTRLVDSTIEAEHILKKSEEFSKDDRILVPEKADLTKITGIPKEHQSERRVRIFIPAKSATQSGDYGTRLWRIEFDNRERWENPLMGWASSGDPLSNTTLTFSSAEAAEEFCQRNGWPCYVDQPHTLKTRVRSYGANFSWNKRTRVGSK